jgi:hypothetical protein
MIEYLADSGPRQPEDDAPEVEFVDGPWAGRRERVSDPPASLPTDGGWYHRSVRCADDGALRFVYAADPTATAR